MAWTLRNYGFSNTRALVGGFDAWESAGYPIEPKVDRKPGQMPLKGSGQSRSGVGATKKLKKSVRP